MSNKHIFTVIHNFEGPGKSFAAPIVSRPDGIWQCRVVERVDKWDFAVLRVESLIDAHSGALPDKYPSMGASWGVGSTVGYMTWMKKVNVATRAEVRYKFFGHAHVSYFGADEVGNSRYILTPSFVEAGFSGGPIFNRDGMLIGLLAGAFKVDAVFDKLGTFSHILPYMTIFPKLSESTKAELQTAWQE